MRNHWYVIFGGFFAERWPIWSSVPEVLAESRHFPQFLPANRAHTSANRTEWRSVRTYFCAIAERASRWQFTASWRNRYRNHRRAYTTEIRDNRYVNKITRDSFDTVGWNVAFPNHRTETTYSHSNPKEYKFIEPVSVFGSNVLKCDDIWYDFCVFRCANCDERFLTIYKLKMHVKKHHFKLEFKCTKDNCNESFTTKAILVRHIKEKHTTVKCEQCHKEVRQSYLKKHIRSVHSLEDQTMCHLCGKVSNTKEAHNVHYITEHSDQNGVQCDICKTW